MSIHETDNIPMLDTHSCGSSSNRDIEQELKCLCPWLFRVHQSLPGQQLTLQQTIDALVKHEKSIRETPGLLFSEAQLPGMQVTDVLAEHGKSLMEEALPGFVTRIPNPRNFRVNRPWKN